MNFYRLKDNIIYCHVDNFGEFSYYLKTNKELHTGNILYTAHKQWDDTSKDNLFYLGTNNFSVLFNKHNKIKNRLSQVKSEVSSQVYKQIVNVGVEDLSKNAKKFNKKTNPIIELGIKQSLDTLSNYINENCITDLTFNDFLNSVNWTCSKKTEFKDYFNNFFTNFIEKYSTPVFKNIIDTRLFYETVYLEDVFYKNKTLFDCNGNLLSSEQLKTLNNDIEYVNFNKKDFVLDIQNCKKITEPVLFLDYIYNFYNFGEFWDIVQRLIFLNAAEQLEIFGLLNNRVLNISEYFNKLGYNYPPKYINTVKWNDYTPENGVFFKKVYFSCINNTCRGALNPWAAYEMNKIYNPDNIVKEEYKLYLIRGKMARGIENEEEIINTFKDKYGFKILDGSETLEEHKHYFTNASIIIGAHSSLMKNIVWCKKNPIFIEMCPSSRTHMCFYGNAQQLGFPAIIMPFLCNEKEEIIIEQNQREALYKLIELFL